MHRTFTGKVTPFPANITNKMLYLRIYTRPTLNDRDSVGFVFEDSCDVSSAGQHQRLSVLRSFKSRTQRRISANTQANVKETLGYSVIKTPDVPPGLFMTVYKLTQLSEEERNVRAAWILPPLIAPSPPTWEISRSDIAMIHWAKISHVMLIS